MLESCAKKMRLIFISANISGSTCHIKINFASWKPDVLIFSSFSRYYKLYKGAFGKLKTSACRTYMVDFCVTIWNRRYLLKNLPHKILKSSIQFLSKMAKFGEK